METHLRWFDKGRRKSIKAPMREWKIVQLKGIEEDIEKLKEKSLLNSCSMISLNFSFLVELNLH